MSFADILNILLPLGFLLAVAALVWFIVELVITVRRTRAVIDGVQKQITPTLEHVEEITASLKPVVTKVDPLVERVSLTVDAANLEIMRVDQILEDVKEVTGTISSAAEAIDSATNAPFELVSNVTSKVRNALKPKHASSESIELGKVKAEKAPEKEKPRSAFGKHASVVQPSAETTQVDTKPPSIASETSVKTSSEEKPVAEKKTAEEAETPQKQYFTYVQEPVKDDKKPAGSTEETKAGAQTIRQTESKPEVKVVEKPQDVAVGKSEAARTEAVAQAVKTTGIDAAAPEKAVFTPGNQATQDSTVKQFGTVAEAATASEVKQFEKTQAEPISEDWFQVQPGSGSSKEEKAIQEGLAANKDVTFVGEVAKASQGVVQSSFAVAEPLQPQGKKHDENVVAEAVKRVRQAVAEAEALKEQKQAEQNQAATGGFTQTQEQPQDQIKYQVQGQNIQPSKTSYPDQGHNQYQAQATAAPSSGQSPTATGFENVATVPADQGSNKLSGQDPLNQMHQSTPLYYKTDKLPDSLDYRDEVQQFFGTQNPAEEAPIQSPTEQVPEGAVFSFEPDEAMYRKGTDSNQ